jgi:hypothetical protein
VSTPDREAREKALGRIQTLVRANFGQGLLIVPDALDSCGMPYYREEAEAAEDESEEEDA